MLTIPISGFLNLPNSIRARIYAYLFPSHPEENVTTINYTLSWPYLDNPSNTTFTGAPQIDFCTCPRQDAHLGDDQHESHIYTRYKCQGPDVRFKRPSEGLWVLQAAHGQFNILRPGPEDKFKDDPSIAILQVSRQIHDEALPFLYRDRDFFFLTGPCPRGRYQAYATLQWLKQLSSQARGNIEVLSLLVQPYEEDCSVVDVESSYAELAVYIRDELLGFKWLCLDVWDQVVYRSAHVFSRLFENERTGIVVRQRWEDFEAEVFLYKEEFLRGFENST